MEDVIRVIVGMSVTNAQQVDMVLIGMQDTSMITILDTVSGVRVTEHVINVQLVNMLLEVQTSAQLVKQVHILVKELQVAHLVLKVHILALVLQVAQIVQREHINQNKVNGVVKHVQVEDIQKVVGMNVKSVQVDHIHLEMRVIVLNVQLEHFKIKRNRVSVIIVKRDIIKMKQDR